MQHGHVTIHIEITDFDGNRWDGTEYVSARAVREYRRKGWDPARLVYHHGEALMESLVENEHEDETGYDPMFSPDPELPLKSEYFGILVSSVGEDGDLIALGHHELWRVIAAWNRYARKEWGLCNLFDNRSATYADVAPMVKETWAQRLIGCERCHRFEVISTDQDWGYIRFEVAKIRERSCPRRSRGPNGEVREEEGTCQPLGEDSSEWMVRWVAEGKPVTREDPYAFPVMILEV